MRFLSPLKPEPAQAHSRCSGSPEKKYLFSGSAMFIMWLVALTGCSAAYQTPPLSTNHPAHPEAMAASEPATSDTLAYESADRPSPQPISNMAQYDEMKHDKHGVHGSQQATQAGQQTVVGEGKVIAIVPGSSQIVVDHKDIKGFMGAMTMGYAVDPPSLLEEVKAGDIIRFFIDTQQNAIIKIEKVELEH